MAIKFETILVAELEARKIQSDQSPDVPVVLVVDDEQAVADSLVTILNHSGYAAEAAYDSETALQMALLVPPELLLTDVAMPGMGGIELAIAVQKAVPDCRVLLLSEQAAATGALSADVRNVGQGEFNFLPKPVHPDDLLAETSRLFGHS
jgi:DNA-binding NtrC family response regulator